MSNVVNKASFNMTEEAKRTWSQVRQLEKGQRTLATYHGNNDEQKTSFDEFDSLKQIEIDIKLPIERVCGESIKTVLCHKYDPTKALVEVPFKVKTTKKGVGTANFKTTKMLRYPLDQLEDDTIDLNDYKLLGFSVDMDDHENLSGFMEFAVKRST